MKKFFVNLRAGNYYDSPHIKEIEYDHFDSISEKTIIGYDGDILPDGLQRRYGQIRFSLFFSDSLHDTLEDAKKYLKNTLKNHLKEIESEFEKLQKQVNNIKEALYKYED